MSTRWYAADWLLFEGELREGWGLEVSEDGHVSIPMRFSGCFAAAPNFFNPARDPTTSGVGAS